MGACRDCKNCTNSTIVHAARKTGRIIAAIGTYGTTELVMAARKKSRVCGHQMSLHGIEQVFGVPQPLVETESDPGPRMRGWIASRMVRPVEPAPTADESAPAPPTPAPASSVADELSKLAQLRDAGVLTPEEFEAQKAKLLG